VKVNNGGNSARLHNLSYDNDQLAATVVDFLIRRAEAQVSGQTVTVWDATGQIAEGTTDAAGEVGFVVGAASAGTYTVCVGVGANPTATPGSCAVVADPITETDVLIATVSVDSTQTLMVSGVSEPRTDNVALFEDTNHPGPNTKIIICHKPDEAGQTLSISENAVEAHLNHGDILGACNGGDTVVAGDPDDDSKSDDDQQSADSGKPDHAGKPSGSG
jgi:hypothetical protein